MIYAKNGVHFDAHDRKYIFQNSIRYSDKGFSKEDITLNSLEETIINALHSDLK